MIKSAFKWNCHFAKLVGGIKAALLGTTVYESWHCKFIAIMLTRKKIISRWCGLLAYSVWDIVIAMTVCPYIYILLMRFFVINIAVTLYRFSNHCWRHWSLPYQGLCTLKYSRTLMLIGPIASYRCQSRAQSGRRNLNSFWSKYSRNFQKLAMNPK